MKGEKAKGKIGKRKKGASAQVTDSEKGKPPTPMRTMIG
jgi:hypothetical protein